MRVEVLLATAIVALSIGSAFADGSNQQPFQIRHTAAVMEAEDLLPNARAVYTRVGSKHFELSLAVGAPARSLDIGAAAVPAKFAICSLFEAAQSLGKSSAVLWQDAANKKEFVAFIEKEDEVGAIAMEFGLKPEQLQYVAASTLAQSFANSGYPCKRYSDPPPPRRNAVATRQLPPAGSVFKDCDLCPTMVSIPGGSFDMGLDSKLFPRFMSSNAEPVHKVTVAGFAIGQTEVTRGEFAAFVSDTQHVVTGRCLIREISGPIQSKPEHTWRNPGFEQDDRHPVVCVGWQDADAYVKWLSKKTGRGYRLPSEAEWEYAARAGTTTPRYWDGTGMDACGFANVPDATFSSRLPKAPHLSKPSTIACDDGFAYTAPVRTFRPNSFGLFDMIGNVWEWVQDRFNEGYVGAPSDGSAWTTSKYDFRVYRGGSWLDASSDFSAATRSTDVRYRNQPTSIFGFRVALTD